MILNDRPLIKVIDDFLTKEVCQDIINESTPLLEPSKISGGESGYRTSKSTWLSHTHSHATLSLLEAVTKLANVGLEYCEPISIIKYESGEEYKKHVDFNTLSNNIRVATVIIYLNDVSSGGLTSFPNLNYSVKPVCGRATYFKYDYKDEETNMKTLHVGEPPTDGAIKWIATVWIHEKPYKRII